MSRYKFRARMGIWIGNAVFLAKRLKRKIFPGGKARTELEHLHSEFSLIKRYEYVKPEKYNATRGKFFLHYFGGPVMHLLYKKFGFRVNSLDEIDRALAIFIKQDPGNVKKLRIWKKALKNEVDVAKLRLRKLTISKEALEKFGLEASNMRHDLMTEIGQWNIAGFGLKHFLNTEKRNRAKRYPPF